MTFPRIACSLLTLTVVTPNWPECNKTILFQNPGVCAVFSDLRNVEDLDKLRSRREVREVFDLAHCLFDLQELHETDI